MISHENYTLLAGCLIPFYGISLHLRSLIVLTNKPIQRIKESITVALQGFIDMATTPNLIHLHLLPLLPMDVDRDAYIKRVPNEHLFSSRVFFFLDR